MKRFNVSVRGKEDTPLGFDNVWTDGLTEESAKEETLKMVSVMLDRPAESLVVTAKFVKEL